MQAYLAPFLIVLVIAAAGMFVLDWGLMNLQGMSLVFNP